MSEDMLAEKKKKTAILEATSYTECLPKESTFDRSFWDVHSTSWGRCDIPKWVPLHMLPAMPFFTGADQPLAAADHCCDAQICNSFPSRFS